MPADGDRCYRGRWKFQEEEVERLTCRRKPLLMYVFDTDDTPLLARCGKHVESHLPFEPETAKE